MNGCTASQAFMAAFLILAGLSGTAIAFYSELDRMLNPELYQVPNAPRASLNADGSPRGVGNHPGLALRSSIGTAAGRELSS